jgi:hypothetical protein
LPVLRDKTAFFKGYITQDAESAEIFRGIDDVCQLFALQYFLSSKPLKILWADPPTAMRIWVKSFGKLFQKKKIIIPYICFVHHHKTVHCTKMLNFGNR